MAKALNILHISFHKDWRGGEQQATYLMDELRKKNCYQWVLCTNGNAMETYCKEHGLSSYSVKPGFFKNFSNRHILRDLALKHNIDIIHVQDSKAHTLAYMACSNDLKKPIVVHRRVDFPVKDNFLSRKKYNMECIQKYICVSDAVRKILEKDVEDKTKLTVVYDGIDVSRFKNQKNTGILRRDFKISPNEYIIGNTSALADHKDYFTFVDTAEYLVKKGMKAKFFIIGEGDLQTDIEKYIADKNLQSHIILTGFRNDIANILPEFDVFLMTSKTEGLGSSLLDAFACKVPIVTTNAGGIPEVIKHKYNGLIANVKDAQALAKNVELVLTDEILRNQLVENGISDLPRFTKEYMASQIFDIYQKIYYSAT